MRNLDAIINQLANEQQRTEALLVQDIEAIKQEAKLFFDKQAREADAYIALLTMRFDDIVSRVKNGYPKGQQEDIGPLPAIVERRILSDEEREAILSKLGEAEGFAAQG
jgi:hypothetical protein